MQIAVYIDVHTLHKCKVGYFLKVKDNIFFFFQNQYLAFWPAVA